MRNKDKKCKISAILCFFFPMKEILVWLHVQMGNERLENILQLFQRTEMTENYMENKGQLTVKFVRKSCLNYVKSDLY